MSSSMQRPSRFRTWPITEVTALEPMLKEMGLKVAASEIDGTKEGKGNCISDALVSVGQAGHGGTGSFISENGLLITNHHVALDAVRQASTVENDYLADGFVARCLEEELAGPDYEVWITRSCEDVSEKVLEAMRDEPEPLARANKGRDRKREIVAEKEASLKIAGLRCEVKEMWPEKSYVLFTFERLRDVRIVYVPPMSLGKFGGDTDNFEWPRHTADFTLLRAYVGPDGQPAEPSKENVPYRPTKYLQVSKKGVQSGDFVFLLGFPGHTMRYAPSSRLAYSDEVAVPDLVKDFGRKLELIRRYNSDRTVSLKTKSAENSLANEFKRSAGKRVMMRKLGLLEERKAEEAKLCEKAPEAAETLQKIANVYDSLRTSNSVSNALEMLRGIYHGSALLFAGHTLHEASIEAKKPDGEREANYRERDRAFIVQRLKKRLESVHVPIELELVKDAVSAAKDAGLLDEAGVATVLGDPAEAVQKSVDYYASLSSSDLEEALKTGSLPDEPFSRIAALVYDAYVKNRDATKSLLSQRDQLLAKLLELQRLHSEETFYPDANGTLRVSAGHIDGYIAADAVHHSPLTTLAGVMDKHAESVLVTGGDGGDYACPNRLVDHCKKAPDALTTPVCCLYSTDTVGGNSGSPVLNANGEFVGINFDRQRLGLMNEFKWSAEYSRSIGVDVRYILWLIGTYDSAEHLLKEMGASS